MKKLKKILTIVIVLIIVTIQLPSFAPKSIELSSNIPTRKPVKVAGIFYSFDDIFISLIMKNLEDIQKENPDKVQFTFFDGKSNPAIQFENINKSIEDDFDFIILNIVENRKEIVNEIFLKFRTKNVPVILTGADIPRTNVVNSYSRAFFINSDSAESGIVQGKLIADAWYANKETMDKNNDDTLQYILLRGTPNSIYTTIRSKYCIEIINNSGIKTQELAAPSASWSREEAKNIVSSLFLKYGNKVEAIIANNDAMAIGAIEALQQYGYNKGDKLKSIPVFGCDGIEEAKELIKKGYMAGTVFQDTRPIAKAIYDVGINLVSDENPVQGTNLKINGREIIVPLTIKPYTINSNYKYSIVPLMEE